MHSQAGSRMSVMSGGSMAHGFRSARSASGKLSTLNRRSTEQRRRRRKDNAWYNKPLVNHAGYTDLNTAAWHIGFYSIAMAVWTISTSIFDLYCLHEAMPGSSHTGYYIISFDFVYVGNPHVRNLLALSALVCLIVAVAILVVSVMLLDGLRKEQEHAFKPYIALMFFFVMWRVVGWAFSAVVNDHIFFYNIAVTLIWIPLQILNVLGLICVHALYLELHGLTRLQDMAQLKMDTMSHSRAASSFGSRPVSPHYGHREYATHARTGGSLQQQQQLLQPPTNVPVLQHHRQQQQPAVVTQTLC